MFIINPGTESQKNTTLENALESAKRFVKDLDLPGLKLKRFKENDDCNGWFGFKLILEDNEVELDIPGVNPDVFVKGIPFKSPRCYINGSSWLYNYAISVAQEELTGNETNI